MISSYALLPSILLWSARIDLYWGNRVRASPSWSTCCESGRWREESAAGRIQRKQELGEGVGWRLKWRAWRHSGWADVALQTAVLTSRWLLPKALLSIFLFFLSWPNWWCAHFPADETSNYWQKPFQLWKIQTKIMLRIVLWPLRGTLMETLKSGFCTTLPRYWS